MKVVLKTLLNFVSIVVLCMIGAMPAHAVPVKYILDKPFPHSSAPDGWFIFDRDTASFGGYQIVFDDYGAPDFVVATFDSPTILSSSVDGFTFTDNTTAVSPLQAYNVHLGGFGF